MKYKVLCLLCCLLGYNPLSAQVDSTAVRIDRSGEFITFVSPYYAVAWAKAFPMMSYLGVEAGARSTRYTDRSLLRPGKGGVLIGNQQDSFGKSGATAFYQAGSISYEQVDFGNGENRNCIIYPQGAHAFAFDITAGNKQMSGEIFRLYTAPDVSPVSVWSKKTDDQPSTQYDTPESFYTPRIVKASFQLPAVLHFPDYGLVKIEANEPTVYLQEHFLPDYDNAGLSLGPFNRGGHTYRKSVHLGSVVLSFHARKPIEKTTIKFTVLEDNYPHLEGVDLSDHKFDGLRRCWQNAFTLNPETMTMGDNIMLSGIGHLALAFRADLLPFTPALDASFSMIDGLRNSIEIALQERIDPHTNRIADFGYECTEITLIALYDYLITTHDWDFIRQYLPEIKRLVKGVLDRDIDHDGIFEAPFHGNRLEDGRTSFNWWDDFAFGHKDAYLNLQAYRALEGMQKVFGKLQEDTNSIEQALKKFRQAFHYTFYNPETGVYAGWVSLDGRMHDYMFTFITSMAINEGLVPQEQGEKMMHIMLAKMKEQGYDGVYGVPGPLLPVAKEDKGTWDEMTRWGRYENGGLCGQAACHFLNALYHVGLRDEADDILFKMLATFEREYTHSGVFPGYVQSVDWRTKGGAPSGYNYLADNYYFLLAAITGHFGVKYPELTDPSRQYGKE
ncbi:MAG: hypothetical protein J6U14_05670 [Bacteroidaceae bacterium]|nr:hypothetical protein [Bacteroidaceae bacterium]